MANAFSALRIIAENRILEAEKAGAFDNLPGAGKPLELSDDSAIPEDLRMAYKILKYANCLPREIADRKEISHLADLLAKGGDEAKMLAAAKKARFLLARLQISRNRPVWLDESDPCYRTLLEKLARLDADSLNQAQDL